MHLGGMVKDRHWALIFMKGSAVPGSKALPTVQEPVKTLPLRTWSSALPLTASPRASAQRWLKSKMTENTGSPVSNTFSPALRSPFVYASGLGSGFWGSVTASCRSAPSSLAVSGKRQDQKNSVTQSVSLTRMRSSRRLDCQFWLLRRPSEAYAHIWKDFVSKIFYWPQESAWRHYAMPRSRTF